MILSVVPSTDHMYVRISNSTSVTFNGVRKAQGLGGGGGGGRGG